VPQNLLLLVYKSFASPVNQTMKNLIVPFFCILLFGVQTVIAQNNNDIIIGSKFIINSNILDEDRTCLISLPDSYNDSSEGNKKYPIIILLDGYTHFKTAAGIVHFMSSNRNRNNFMPETIIVAIENVDRERDFTVTKIKTTRPNTMGGGRNFLNFIEKELIPYVDKNYRTETNRTLVGHSLGGLLTLNSYIDENSLFNAYISIDPSIWWDEQMMTEKVDSIQPLSLKKKLYIATANQGEANYERNKKRHDVLYTLLNKKPGDSIMVKSEYFENESHRSVPLIALYEGLKYLYDVDY
jgi:predicted alpha/beta superfamily hydrolase